MENGYYYILWLFRKERYIECSTFKNSDIKCLYCNEESLKINKCIKCNNKLGYYPILYDDNEDKYEQCYNDKTKLNNFYFDSYSKSYKLCYELCSTCNNVEMELNTIVLLVYLD